MKGTKLCMENLRHARLIALIAMMYEDATDEQRSAILEAIEHINDAMRILEEVDEEMDDEELEDDEP